MDHDHLAWLNKLLGLINAYRALPFPAMTEQQIVERADARISILRHMSILFRASNPSTDSLNRPH